MSLYDFIGYDHIETLSLHFHTTFQWLDRTSSSLIFPNVCHLSLWFTDFYSECDSDEFGCCNSTHYFMKPEEYHSVWTFLKEILPLSKLQSLEIYSSLPENYLIQLLSSTTNLTKLKLDDWKGKTSNRISLYKILVINISTIFQAYPESILSI